jgi:metal-dependent amidase/aminoacylase/carboxypeptidase family protein
MAKSGADASRQNYFVLGIVPRDRDLARANPNHSPSFFIDEKSLVVGVCALAMAATNQLAAARTD